MSENSNSGTNSKLVSNTNIIRNLAQKRFQIGCQREEREAPLRVDKNIIGSFLFELIDLLYPEFFSFGCTDHIELEIRFYQNKIKLLQVLRMFVDYSSAEIIADSFYGELVQISDLLDLDAQAIFEGDPAANSLSEVIITYPGLLAITVHRLAHFFYTRELKTFARILSEYSHKETGIDIHPGATIGKSFCIDHGTGIVIGETTQIGDQVKIYQGVTLGALSVKKKLQGIKRHPSIMNNCILYAHATILGGDTVIGENSVIGGNVWLTESVPPNSVIYNKDKMKIGP